VSECSLAVLCTTHFRKESSSDAVRGRMENCLTTSGTVVVNHSSPFGSTNHNNMKGYINFKHRQEREKGERGSICSNILP